MTNKNKEKNLQIAVRKTRKYKLTKKQIKEGYVWRCPDCGDLSKFKECICEKCMGADA